MHATQGAIRHFDEVLRLDPNLGVAYLTRYRDWLLLTASQHYSITSSLPPPSTPCPPILGHSLSRAFSRALTCSRIDAKMAGGGLHVTLYLSCTRCTHATGARASITKRCSMPPSLTMTALSPASMKSLPLPPPPPLSHSLLSFPSSAVLSTHAAPLPLKLYSTRQ